MRITGTDVMALTVVTLCGGTAVALTAAASRGDGHEASTITTTTWIPTAQARHDDEGRRRRRHRRPARSEIVRLRATEAPPAPGDNILRFRSEVVVAQPLIYIDGQRTDRSVEDLAPDEIERIEVVKGAAAIELFGEEALGGVIQIFTKTYMTRDPGS